MPEKTLQLTKEEKENIIAKHKALVDEFNQYLPEELRIAYNKDLDKILDGEEAAKNIKNIEFINVRSKKQQAIFDDYIKNNPIPDGKNILPRSVWHALKTEDTPEAKKFNKKYLDEYRKNPEKIFYQRHKKLLEFNPKKLLDIIDDKEKVVEFYLNNQEICEDAFVFAASMRDPASKVNPVLKEAAEGMIKTIETLSYPMSVIKSYSKTPPYIFPKMNQTQAAMLMNAHPKYMEGEGPYKDNISEALNGAEKDRIKDIYKTITDYGYRLEPGFFLKYQALEHNRETNRDVEISLDDGIKNLKNNGDLCVRERQPEEIDEMLRINNAREIEYLKIWQKNFSNNYEKQPFNLEAIKEANKGGFFERLFKKTSPQYTAFIQTFKEYNDPKSPNYLNKDLLRDRAEDYFNYKTEKGVSFSRLDETSRGRLQLVSAVIKTINEMERDNEKVERQIDKNLEEEQVIVRKSFLKEKEVEDNQIINDINKEEIIINNEISQDIKI